MLNKLYMFGLLFVVFACSSKPERPSILKKGGEGAATPGGPSNIPGGKEPGPGPGPAPSPTPGAPVFDLTFVAERSNLRSIPYRALANKLKVVTGLDDNSESLKAAAKVSLSLGAYDHAQGVLPDQLWNIDKMGTWMGVADSACRSEGVLKRIQAANGDKDFIEAAYGRDLSPGDQELLKELNSKNLAGPRRARVLCNIILLSAEFVSL